MKKTFLILDGNALLHRAWHAIPPLTTADGRVVNAAYGFTMIIEKMREKFEPDYMAVAWDLPGETFRHAEFADYKATREKKEDELYEQIELIQEILDLYGIPSLSAKGMEADDVIGTLAATYGSKKDIEVLILTGDMDSLQLVNPHVTVVAFVKGLSETKTYDIAGVQERYGLRPDQLIDLKALMGDPSDNIPGIAGVGKKTATALLREYGSIKGIFQAIKKGKVPDKFAKKFIGREKEVEKMQRLVTIVRDVDLDVSLKDAAVRAPDASRLADLFRELNFRAFVKKYAGEDVHMTQKRVKQKKAASVQLHELQTEMLALSVDVGPQDLFGGSIRGLALFDGTSLCVLDHPDAKALASVLAIIKQTNLLIGHDLKAAFHALQVPGEYTWPNLFDTMVGAYLLSPGSRTFDLSSVAYEQAKIVLKESASAAECVQTMFELHEIIQKGLAVEGTDKIARDIDFPLIPILYRMEREGIAVDKAHLKTLSSEFGKQLEKRTKQIYALAGREFNINSPTQLAEILFDELALPTKGIKKTKSGFSTAASELEKLWDAHAIIPLISEYREFAKLKSTYVDALPELVKEDGRIHTTFNITIAATGRLSSTDPNLQNIPIRTQLGNEIRKAFVAPKGRVLVSMDYSQFELRLAAHIAKDESFIRAFREGADIHTRTAAEILGKEESVVTKEERRAAKAINFGILYGMGPRNLARSTGLSQEEAKQFIERYFEVHPGIQQYIDAMKLSAHEEGHVETLFGRRRYLPDINSNIHMLVAAAERMAVNMPIQGTQADLIKMAMIHVQQWIDQEDVPVKMLLQVHDELVFEIPKKQLSAVVEPIRNLMASVHAFDVPLEVNVEVGTSWGDQMLWE